MKQARQISHMSSNSEGPLSFHNFLVMLTLGGSGRSAGGKSTLSGGSGNGAGGVGAGSGGIECGWSGEEEVGGTGGGTGGGKGGGRGGGRGGAGGAEGMGEEGKMRGWYGGCGWVVSLS